MSESWCGYIDMLSTRSIAQRSAQDLRDALMNFHSALEMAFDSFKSGQCYAFSDGAFFRCDSADDFFKFYKLVRNELFQNQIFFRCSFLKGDIGVIERTESNNQKEILSSGKKRRFFSMTFTEDAARAYQKESEFKGIGCSVDAAIDPSFTKSNAVTSYYVIQMNGGVRAVKVNDVAFSTKELDRSISGESPLVGDRRIFDALVEACQVTLTFSERIGAYYSMPLVTAIRSLDLSAVDYLEDVWVNTPYVFEELMSGPIPRALRHMPGVHLVLLTCFDQLYRQRGSVPKAAERQVMLQLGKFPQCFRRLDDVPDFVISHAARGRLIKLHVELEKETERHRRQVRSQATKRGDERRTKAESKAKSSVRDPAGEPKRRQ